MIFILVFLLIFITLFSKKLYNAYFSPITLMGYVWFGMGIVYTSGIIEYTDITVLTWIVYFISYFFFFIGCIFTTLLYKRNKNIHEYSEYFNSMKLRKAINVLFILCGIAGILQVGIYINNYGIMQLFDVRFGRDNMSQRFLGNIVYLSSLVIVLITFYMSMFKTTRKQKIKYVLQIIIMLVFTATTYNKSGFIRLFGWLFFLHVLLNYSKLNAKKIMIFVGISLLFFITFSNILSPYYDGDYKYWVANRVVKLPYSLKGLSLPLVYFSGSLPTLSVHIDEIFRSNDLGYGYYTFRPIVSLINVFFSGISIPETHSEFYYVGRDLVFNVYTYLRPFVDDFGILGVILGPFFEGIIVNWFYLQLIYKQKYEYLFAVSFIFWIVFLSFFSNHFIYNYNLIYIIVSIITGKISVDKSYKKRLRGVK